LATDGRSIDAVRAHVLSLTITWSGTRSNASEKHATDSEYDEVDAENDRVATEIVEAELRLAEIEEAYAIGRIEAGSSMTPWVCFNAGYASLRPTGEPLIDFVSSRRSGRRPMGGT
jgi:hypothetical protein